jgi:methionyl-tRNA formyltransferase
MNKNLRIVFAGTPEFAVPALAALLDAGQRVMAVYTQPDRPAGRGRKLAASPVKQLAAERGLPVLQPRSLKDPGSLSEFRALSPDVLVVVAYGLILPPPVLEIPRLGCVNIHASLLPRWRGAAPIQRAILAGDSETGVTIMQMDAGLDTGPMLLKRSCPIGPRENAAELHDRLSRLGADAVVEALPALAAGELVGEQQDDSRACYARKLEKVEASIDWTRSAEELDRQIRAFNPWPVAFTDLDGATMRIWEAEPIPASAAGFSPGTVVHSGRDGIEVAAGRGVVRIRRLQMPGKRVMTAAEFVNARRIDGAVLG